MADVSVFEDPAAARWILDALMPALTKRVRRDGLGLPPRAQEVLQALADVADLRPDVERFAGETAVESVDVSASWLTASEAAARSGVSVQYVRRLARGERIRRQWIGRQWLVDVESLERVLRRTA